MSHVARPRKLKPRHRKLLHDRAVADELTQARGYWSLEDPDEFKQLGWSTSGPNRPPQYLKPPGLAIPVWSVMEQELGEEDPTYSQFRPDRPAKDKDGKARKYLNPSGSQAVIDCNPACFGSDLWLDRDEPLFIVEGIPKGDACWTAGIPAVSIQGVWNFTTEDGDGYREVLPDLRYLPVAGRDVVIAFDADAWTNPDVRAAAREMGRLLSIGNKGASSVKALRLPDPEKKTGVDDFLARGHKDPKQAVLDLVVDLDELAKSETLKTTCLNDIESAPPVCLWEPYLLKDTLNFLDGAPGVGKTWLALVLTAAVTQGRKLPTAWKGKVESETFAVQKGKVLYLTQENNPKTSLRPRLERLNANLKNVFVQTFDSNAEDWASLLDLGPLAKLVKEMQPTLVVLDPIMNFMGESTDTHRDNEVRPMLSRLMQLAEETSTTILGIRHLRKAATGSAVYAAGGSVAFSGAARSVVIAAKHQKEGIGEVNVLAHAKANDTPPGASLEYDIRDEGKDEEGYFLSSFEWKGIAEVAADDLVNSAAGGGQQQTPKTDNMRKLVAQLLDDNPDGVPALTMMSAAESIEVSESTLRRVAAELGVEKFKKTGSGKDSPWHWKWPAGHIKPERKSAPKSTKY